MKKKIVWYKLFLTIFVSFRMLFRISFYDLNEKVPRFDIDVTLPNRFYVITVSIFSNCLNEKSVSHKLFFMLLYIIHVNLSTNVWELNEKWGDPNLISHARFSAYTHVGRAWNALRSECHLHTNKKSKRSELNNLIFFIKNDRFTTSIEY